MIDPERYVVMHQGQELNLPKKEFELLSLLASQPGKVFSREKSWRACGAPTWWWATVPLMCTFANSGKNSGTNTSRRSWRRIQIRRLMAGKTPRAAVRRL